MFIVSHFHPAASLPASAWASARETTGMFLKKKSSVRPEKEQRVAEKRVACSRKKSSVFFGTEQRLFSGTCRGRHGRTSIRLPAHAGAGGRAQLCRQTRTVV